MLKNFFSKIGPGALIAAAFIGPGTVSLCTKAGLQFGYDLLWVMLIAIMGTFILQEITVRIALVAQKGILQAIGQLIQHQLAKRLFYITIFLAILIGNTAFEAGNIAGGSMGLNLLFSGTQQTNEAFRVGPLIIGGIAAILLFIGHYKTLERALIMLVVFMSISFMITALLTFPVWSEIVIGLIPSTPTNSFFTIVGLIGTTIVPYNLFLHASSVREKWSSVSDLKAARRDAFAAILVGGIVSISIIIAAAATKGALFTQPADLALALEPLFGSSAKYLMGIGLFAAGITSAITAPLAAAYVGKEAFGWQGGLKNSYFKLVWMLVLGIGVFFASTGIKPLEIIQFAQFLNGVLLPFIAVVLFWGINQKKIMGHYVNSPAQNIGAALIILFTLFISFKTFVSLFSL